MTDLELLEILKTGEKVDIECKESTNEIPRSLWESYSAMANTNGGIIILGIQEDKHREVFEVTGVINANKRIIDFWNTINSDKVNRNILVDENIEVLTIDEKEIIIINIPRSNYKERPIYINGNPYKGTYKRNSEGDYHCTNEEVNAMIRDSSDEGNDGTIIEGYSINDLDLETIKKYRNRFNSRQPEHPWNELSNEQFLEMLGAIDEDRRKDIRGVTMAGMLMFGQGLYVRNLFSVINFDYREEIGTDSDMRWSDRLTIDGTWENNLYNFYFMIINKLTENVKTPFVMENLERVDDTPVHKAIKEAFVNQIIHADFNIQGTLKIIKRKEYLEFSNPGTLKIELEAIYKGGNSKSRNPRLQKMLSLIGLGEGAGSGFPKILSAWRDQHWRVPELKEENSLRMITLKLWMISMIPEECLEKLTDIYGDTINKYSKDEILILSTAFIEGSVNNARIQLMLDKHSYEITKVFQELVIKGALVVDGYGRGRLYYINYDFIAVKNYEKSDEGLSEDEIIILEYIKRYGKIDNATSREKLGFSKNRNIDLFANLTRKNRINRLGEGRNTYYTLSTDSM